MSIKNKIHHTVYFLLFGIIIGILRWTICIVDTNGGMNFTPFLQAFLLIIALLLFVIWDIVYRVDLKDGRETRVRATSFRLPDLTKLLKLVAISSKEEVLNYLLNNYPASMIYPAGVIVDGLVIEKATVKAEKEPVLTLPQQRK